MAKVKTKEEIELMKKSGEICAKALKKVVESVRPGISCRQLDEITRASIEEQGATSSFMTVDDYKFTICTTLNDEVVHGIPREIEIKDGDILGIDIGALYENYHSDMSISLGVGSIGEDKRKFLDVGKETLGRAIKQARVGNRIGDISSTIQKSIEEAGYSVVKSLSGHGIGKSLHEEPFVPEFGKPKTGECLLANMVLAIEVIYAQGSGEIKLEEDGWTLSTVDGSLGGLFEQTVRITEDGPIVLTPYL